MSSSLAMDTTDVVQTTPHQLLPPYEHRLALSRLLLDIYLAIDHHALFGALRNTRSQDVGTSSASSSRGEGQFPYSPSYTPESPTAQPKPEADASTTTEAAGPIFPTELSMTLVLTTALQYLRSMSFGHIASFGACSYSHNELVANMRILLDQPRTAHLHDSRPERVTYIKTAMRTVLEQLALGNWPVEPVARYFADESVRFVFPCLLREPETNGCE